MKLLSYTSRTQLLLFLVLFGVFSVLFYLILSWNVLQNVDEVLYNRKVNLLAYLKGNTEVSFEEDNPLDDFTFHPISKTAFQSGKESYMDTLIYESVDAELDEYRKLISFVELNGNFYELVIVRPHLEASEMISTIAITLGGLFLGLSLSFYLFQRIISQKIWEPFFEMLEKLRHFRLDQQELPELPSSHIDEFQMLNEAVNELTRKNIEVFVSQKQFIEDASHELQTPLSIIQSKLESLVGQTPLTAEQAAIVEGIIGSTQRLKKLNKTLLLLSKIENRQFLLTEEVKIREIITKSLEYYEEQKEVLNISVEVDIRENPNASGNNILTQILIQNLLKNAFLHNTQNGSVTICAKKNTLTIINTGSDFPVNHDKIFSRFYKESNNPDTLGLGLAIARKITDTSGWGLSYIQKKEIHMLEVTFQ